MPIALIIIDMQNAFFIGSFVKRGFELLNKEQIIENTKNILAYAREKQWLTIFTKLEFASDYSDAGLLVKKFPEIIQLHAYQGKDAEIINELKPKLNEIVIAKKQYDSFYNTKLEHVLQEKKIDKIVIAGVLTNVCVESTVRSAFEKGFEIEVISDATTTYDKELKNASLKTIEKHFGSIITIDKLLTPARTQ
jgi:ureidoacrylate peracid hydrolase